MAFLGSRNTLDAQGMELIRALESLSIIRRNVTMADGVEDIPQSSQPRLVNAGLHHLSQFPQLLVFVRDWLRFKETVADKEQEFDSLQCKFEGFTIFEILPN